MDTVVIESAKDSTLLSGGISGTADQKQPPTQPQPQLHQHQHQQKHTRTTFSPILETEDTDNVSTVNNLNLHSNTTSKKTTFENPKISNLKKGATNTSKPSLKGSKVSFEQPDNESDDSFEDRRGHFQQKKSLSATDRKGILKVSAHGECIFLWRKPQTKLFCFFFLGSQEFFKRRSTCLPIEKARVIRHKTFENS